MLYCRQCGVQVEPIHRVCPLCRELLDKSPAVLPDPAQAFAASHEETQPSTEQVMRKRGLIIAVYSVALVIPGLICLMVDQLYSGGGWSGYVLTSLGLAWALVFIPLYFMRHILTGSMAMILAMAAYLLGIDNLNGQLDWSLGLALPILAWSALVVFGIWLVFHLFRRTLAFAFAGLFGFLALLCVGIDISIDLFVSGSVNPNWSLVVVVAALPLVLTALLLGFAWKRSSRLRRFLHW